MAARDALLEDHALLIRDGRILDILPTSLAVQRYRATAVLQRGSHLLMPGMVNAQSGASKSLYNGAKPVAAPAGDGVINPEFARDSTLSAMALMLRSGITCFCDRPAYPEESLRTAHEQGMRAVVGMPVTEAPSAWAKNAAESLTRSLSVRDKYKGDPLVSTAFAPEGIGLSDGTFRRLATLADELDAGIMLDLHRSLAEIAACEKMHLMRPIERLENLGLLTPALNAIHMVHLTAVDMNLVQRSGISITLRPQLDLKTSHLLAPIVEFAAAGVRLGLGSGGGLTEDLWTEIKLAALLTNPWEAVHAATRGGAAVLGLESEVGTLEAGKWADLCCIDLSGTATQALNNPLERLVFSGGRDLISDVWVAGRQLLSGGELTRLDCSEVAARSAMWANRLNLRGG